MAPTDEIHHHYTTALAKIPRASIFQLVSHSKISTTRRKKLASVRLGGKKQKRVFSLVRLLRRIKLKWLKVQYTYMLKRLKSFYFLVVKDLIEAGAAFETIQQKIMMETYYGVPVMGVSFASAIPSHIEPASKPYPVRIKK